MNNYNELLSYNVGGAIKLYADEQDNYSKVKNNLNYAENISDKFIEENLECILVCHGNCSNQDYDFYIKVFKQLISKYDMSYDYLKYQENSNRFHIKWAIFISMIVDFLTSAKDNVATKLLRSDIVKDYLNRFHDYFSYKEYFQNLRFEPLEALLEISSYKKEIINSSQYELNNIIKNYMLVSAQLPTRILHNTSFIKNIANNLDSEEYCEVIKQINYNNDGETIDEHHNSFCDNIMSNFNTKNKYFRFMKERDFANKICDHMLLSRVYELLKKENDSAKTIYQQFSKYLIVGFIFSRFFKTSGYNLSIDMKSLIDYIDDPLRNTVFDFPNYDVYYKLVNYRDLDIVELVDLYKTLKYKNIMHEFYDDWHKAQLEFVNELNSNTLNSSNLGEYNENLTNTLDVPVYELNGRDYYMITRNTSKSVISENIKEELSDTKFSRSYLSLSIHNQDHFKYFSHNNYNAKMKFDLKLIYESLDESFVGMINSQDAYTNGISSVEVESDATRQLYPLKRLMQNTGFYNDITYVKTDSLQPVAILCENEILLEQLNSAKELGLPIVLRHNSLYKEVETPLQSKTSYVKNYKSFKNIKL